MTNTLKRYYFTRELAAFFSLLIAPSAVLAESDTLPPDSYPSRETNERAAYPLRMIGTVLDSIRSVSLMTVSSSDYIKKTQIAEPRTEPFTKKSFPKAPPSQTPPPMKKPSNCIYGYEMEVWQKGAFIKGNRMDHTATRTTIHRHCGNAKGKYKVVDLCNHGTCPAKKGMKIKHRYRSTAQTSKPLIPISCDSFREYKVPKVPHENYGIRGHKHVCNNDTFLQMGQIVTGKRPDAQTASRICRNGQYPSRTGRDPKYTPSFANVEAFVSKLGWNPANPDVGGSGSGSTSMGRPPRRMP